MAQMLSSISQSACGGRCPYGSLARTIGYHSYGCSIDYVTEQLHVPFAFTWEIYTDATHSVKFLSDAKEDQVDRKNSNSTGGSPAANFWSHMGDKMFGEHQ